jgi:hypothetical protein
MVSVLSLSTLMSWQMQPLTCSPLSLFESYKQELYLLESYAQPFLIALRLFKFVDGKT